MKSPQGTRHYFVDEAGDTTLFNKNGVVIVGNEGVSHTFIVGVILLADPRAAQAEVEALRSSLLQDPYFQGVPSMKPSVGKTASAFHAKDDLPEVRREVFRVISGLNVEFQAAIRRKSELVPQARILHQRGSKLNPNDIYDNLVKALFKRLLHQAEANEIVFARRGKADRQTALETAILKAKRNFQSDWDVKRDQPTVVRSAVPSDSVGLQIVDYFLWALQRLIERGEDRFFNVLRPKCKLIMDFDDQRAGNRYGQWYTAKNPLTLEKRRPLTN